MKFDLLVTTALIPLLISTANPAHAEKGDVLKILGGVAAGLAIGAAADQGNANEPAQFPIKQQSGSSNANIQWSDTAKPKAVSRASKYDSDVKVVQEFMKIKGYSHATSSYQFDQKTDLKLFSDVNPGVTIKTANVFEIGRDIPKTGWTVVIEADEDIQLPLILSNQQAYKMDKAYQELPASQRKQIERVEEDPSKLWEALAEIDEEVKRQDSINNFYKQYR